MDKPPYFPAGSQQVPDLALISAVRTCAMRRTDETQNLSLEKPWCFDVYVSIQTGTDWFSYTGLNRRGKIIRDVPTCVRKLWVTEGVRVLALAGVAPVAVASLFCAL